VICFDVEMMDEVTTDADTTMAVVGVVAGAGVVVPVEPELPAAASHCWRVNAIGLFVPAQFDCRVL
jgi:hypothetical protein